MTPRNADRLTYGVLIGLLGGVLLASVTGWDLGQSAVLGAAIGVAAGSVPRRA